MLYKGKCLISSPRKISLQGIPQGILIQHLTFLQDARPIGMDRSLGSPLELMLVVGVIIIFPTQDDITDARRKLLTGL